MASYAFCTADGCIREPVSGQEFCRPHLIRAPATIKRAHKLLMVEAAKARDTAARYELQEKDIACAYAVRAADAIKFGRTQSSLEKRILSLQVGCPIDLMLEASLFGPGYLECSIHWYLKPDAHLRGEWFKAEHPRVQKVLDLMKAKNLEGLFQLLDS